MPLNIPILLTWARIVLIPLVVGVFYAHLLAHNETKNHLTCLTG